MASTKPASGARARALLVQRPGALAQQAALVLAHAGFSVEQAAEPYAGLAIFLAEEVDLVVVSLAGFRRRDLAFLAAVRARNPATRVLLLVPATRRHVVAGAIAAGGDATLVEPYDPAELAALAAALMRHRGAAPASASPGEGDVARLAAEVAHAINNPLQVLQLGSEPAGSAHPKIEHAPGEPTNGESMRSEQRRSVERIRDVVEWLKAYGGLRRPQRRASDLQALLRAELERAHADGRATWADEQARRTHPLLAAVDGAQLQWALRAAIHLLAGAAAERPTFLLGRVEPSEGAGGTATGVRIAIVAPDVVPNGVLTSPQAEGLLVVRDDTREALPGLLLPRAVARAHGGSLALRPAAGGGTQIEFVVADA